MSQLPFEPVAFGEGGIACEGRLRHTTSGEDRSRSLVGLEVDRHLPVTWRHTRVEGPVQLVILGGQSRAGRVITQHRRRVQIRADERGVAPGITQARVTSAHTGRRYVIPFFTATSRPINAIPRRPAPDRKPVSSRRRASGSFAAFRDGLAAWRSACQDLPRVETASKSLTAKSLPEFNALLARNGIAAVPVPMGTLPSPTCAAGAAPVGAATRGR